MAGKYLTAQTKGYPTMTGPDAHREAEIPDDYYITCDPVNGTYTASKVHQQGYLTLDGQTSIFQTFDEALQACRNDVA